MFVGNSVRNRLKGCRVQVSVGLLPDKFSDRAGAQIYHAVKANPAFNAVCPLETSEDLHRYGARHRNQLGHHRNRDVSPASATC